MGWELRRGRAFYYRKVRQGMTVVSIYAGGGTAGEAAATEDRARRAARAMMIETRRLEREQLVAEDQTIDAWFRDVEVIARAAMFAAGHYRHARGEWRKRARTT